MSAAIPQSEAESAAVEAMLGFENPGGPADDDEDDPEQTLANMGGAENGSATVVRHALSWGPLPPPRLAWQAAVPRARRASAGAGDRGAHRSDGRRHPAPRLRADRHAQAEDVPL